jgi:fructose/tagatose bisphosphate aldolase
MIITLPYSFNIFGYPQINPNPFKFWNSIINMIQNRNSPAIMLCSKSYKNEEQLANEINEILIKELGIDKKDINMGKTLHYSIKSYKGIFLVIFYDFFSSKKENWVKYTHYDAFLQDLQSVYGFNDINKKGLLLGHFDKDNMFIKYPVRDPLNE